MEYYVEVDEQNSVRGTFSGGSGFLVTKPNWRPITLAEYQLVCRSATNLRYDPLTRVLTHADLDLTAEKTRLLDSLNRSCNLAIVRGFFSSQRFWSCSTTDQLNYNRVFGLRGTADHFTLRTANGEVVELDLPHLVQLMTDLHTHVESKLAMYRHYCGKIASITSPNQIGILNDLFATATAKLQE